MRGILLVVMKQNLPLTLLTIGLACLGLSSCGTGPSMSGSSLSAYQSYNRPASLPSNRSRSGSRYQPATRWFTSWRDPKRYLSCRSRSALHQPLRPKGIFVFSERFKNIAPIATAMPTRATKCADATCAASPQAGVSRAPRCPTGVSSKPTTASIPAG